MELIKAASYLWKCAHNSIGVKECLTRRGVDNENHCPICQGEVESILHALRDCPQVQPFRRQPGVQTINHVF